MGPRATRTMNGSNRRQCTDRLEVLHSHSGQVWMMTVRKCWRWPGGRTWTNSPVAARARRGGITENTARDWACASWARCAIWPADRARTPLGTPSIAPSGACVWEQQQASSRSGWPVGHGACAAASWEGRWWWWWWSLSWCDASVWPAAGVASCACTRVRPAAAKSSDKASPSHGPGTRITAQSI